MRRILLGLLILTSLEVVAQQDFQVLDQYKYFIVNTSMYQGARDPYQASTYLRQKLFGLKYNIIAENEESWPEELIQNPCLGIWVNVITIPKSIGNYQVNIDFYNCQNITLITLTGKGSGSSSANAFHNAIDKAIRNFKTYVHKFNPEMALLAPKSATVALDSLITYFEKGQLEPLEGLYEFKSGLYTYRLGIKKVDSEYIGYVINTDLSNWKGGQVKGRFNKSNRPGLFSVKWFLDDKTEYDTFGYINEDQSLTIEFKKPGDEYQPLTIRKL